jgi:hypothetical protein
LLCVLFFPMKSPATASIGCCLALGFVLTGCTVYELPPQSGPVPVIEAPQPVAEEAVPAPVFVGSPRPEVVNVSPPADIEGGDDDQIVIRVESDFEAPLRQYGRWERVGSFGRCWIPGRVDAEWRPYCIGNWARTEAGWCWASDEPWGWATYHYGRWGWSGNVGWFWVPQTQWAPSWVSWHRGGGYVGWAPLGPDARFGADGSVQINVSAIPSRAFVVVEERRFMQPVRPSTVVVNSATVINNFVSITNIRVVNKTVINEGPRPELIERVSEQKVQVVPVHEFRRKQEAGVTEVSRRRGPSDATVRNNQLGQQAQRDADRRDQELAQKNQQDAARQNQALAEKAKRDAERRDQELAQKNQQDAARQKQALAEKAKRDAERRDQELAQKNQQDAARQNQALAEKAKRDAERRDQELAQKNQQDAARQNQALAEKAKRDAERRDQELAQKNQQDAARQKQALAEKTKRDADQHARESAQQNAAPINKERGQQAQQEAERHNSDSARQAQLETDRSAKEKALKAQQEADRKTKELAAKDAARRAKEAQENNKDGQQTQAEPAAR